MSTETHPGFPFALPATPEEEPPAAGLVRNQTIESQLGHRTIRAFTDEAVDEAAIATLLDVARYAPTSSFYQQVTVIRIKDPGIRQVIYGASGQPYVGAPQGELLIFVIDLSRTARIREAAGVSLEPLGRATVFVQGVEDTLLAAQNVVVAAESLGLGTCLLGSIGGDPLAVIDALHLPKYTYPLVGMLVGHPAQDPQKKPRLPRNITTSVDTYPDVEAPEYRQAWADYDQTIQTYYDMREGGRRQDTFTDQLVRKVGGGKAEKTDMLQVLHDQGLCTH